MSLKQRRDHEVVLHVSPLREDADGYFEPRCLTCGDEIYRIYNPQPGHSKTVYWRHKKRWQKRP